MASLKIVLRAKKNKFGHSPITLRITKNRKSTYIYTGESVDPKYWSGVPLSWIKKSHPHSTRLNNFLQRKLSDANRSLTELDLKEKAFTGDNLKEKITKKRSNETVFSRADLYFDNILKEGKFNRYSGERASINHFKRFRGNKDLHFEDLTVDLLEKFKAYLKGDVKVSERSAINYLITIRSIFNKAIKAGIVDQACYPFGTSGISLKRPESMKIGWEKEEVLLLENFSSEIPFEQHAKNVWLFAFYFAGVRASDVLTLRWSDFKQGRLYYTMRKSLKSGSLKIPEKAQPILDKYRILRKDIPYDLIFPDLGNVIDFNDQIEIQKKLKYRIRKLDRALVKIAKKVGVEKPLSMHIARHTFGNISGSKIPIQKLKELYRHSSIISTINYQKAFMYKDTDEALDSVLDF